MHELDGPDPVDDAAGLGLPVLAQIVEGMADGIFLCDAARRWVYVNDAACAMLGRSVPDLVGRDYVDVVPLQDKAAARRCYAALLEGSTEMLTRMLVHSSGEEREMVFAPFRVSVDGRAHGAALFRDFTETRAAGRAAAALAQSAAELVGERSVSDILAGTARHVVEGTRALWAGLALIGSLAGALATALADPEQRVAVGVTFLVTASGTSFGGIGAPFWGLVAGGVLLALNAVGRRRASR